MDGNEGVEGGWDRIIRYVLSRKEKNNVGAKTEEEKVMHIRFRMFISFQSFHVSDYDLFMCAH
jgi:hypothetical protein